MNCRSCGKELSIPEIRFCPFCATPLAEVTEERRKTIVAFADVSGYTALSEKIDPDELRVMMDEMMQGFAAIVKRKGGTVDKIIGDCLMFLFNAERSFGDEPVRTMETIFLLMKENEKFSQRYRLDLGLHFGVSFGTVSLGSVGSQRTAMGDTVNLAQRLLGMAKKGEVVVSESFAQLFESEFRFKTLDAVSVKGKEKPVTACLFLERVRPDVTSAPFFGRPEELSEIRTVIEQLYASGTGSSFQLIGPPGIGKSALAKRARELTEASRVQWIQLRFAEYGNGFPEPFRDLFSQILAADLPRERKLPFPAELLRSRDFFEGLGFDQIRHLAKVLLFQIPAEHPLVIEIEDMHYADEESASLFASLIELSRSDPVLFLACSRVPQAGFAKTLDVNPLKDSEAHQVFLHYVDDARSREVDVAGLLQSGRGNPLILRELARAVNSGLKGKNLFSGNIEFILAATLDSFSKDDRDLILKVAVMGNRCSTEVLGRFLGISEAEAIQKIESLRLFFRSPQDGKYAFKDDHLRESAYRRVPLHVRKDLHERAAAALELSPSMMEEVARHYLRSANDLKALQATLEVAKRLSKLPRTEEALKFLGQAEALIEKVGTDQDRGILHEIRFSIESKKLDLESGLNRIRQIEILPQVENSPILEKAICSMRSGFLMERGMFDEALKEIERMKVPEELMDLHLLYLKVRALARLERYSDVVRLSMRALKRLDLTSQGRGDFFFSLGFVTYMERELTLSEEYFQKALRAYQEAEDLGGSHKVFQNLGSIALSKANFLLARTYAQKSLETSLKVGDILGYCESLQELSSVEFASMEFSASLGTLDRALQIAQGLGNEDLENQLIMARAACAIDFGDSAAAIRVLTSCAKFFEEHRRHFRLASAYRLMAMALLEMNETERALELCDQASSVGKAYPNQMQLTLLLRSRLLWLLRREEEAQSELQRLQNEYRAETFSPAVKAGIVELESMFSAYTNLALRDRLDEILLDPGTLSPLDRLRFLSVRVEFADKQAAATELLGLIERIMTALPGAYKTAFCERHLVKTVKNKALMSAGNLSVRGPDS